MYSISIYLLILLIVFPWIIALMQSCAVVYAIFVGWCLTVVCSRGCSLYKHLFSGRLRWSTRFHPVGANFYCPFNRINMHDFINGTIVVTHMQMFLIKLIGNRKRIFLFCYWQRKLKVRGVVHKASRVYLKAFLAAAGQSRFVEPFTSSDLQGFYEALELQTVSIVTISLWHV